MHSSDHFESPATGARQFKLYHLVDFKKARHAQCLLMDEERFGGANHMKPPTNYPVFSQIADPFRCNYRHAT